MTRIECVNLLPREIRSRRARRVAVRVWIVTVSLALGVLAAAGVAVRAPAAIKQSQLQRSAGSLRTQIAELEREIQGAQGELATVRRRLDMIRTLEDRPDWGVLLAYVEDLRGEEVVLTRFEVAWGAEGLLKVTLIGQTTTPGSETALVEGLDRSGLFSRTSLLGTRRETVDGDERIVFEIACEFSPTYAEATTP